MVGFASLRKPKLQGSRKRIIEITGVVTDKGEIEAEYVVNCAGMWAGEVGKTGWG